MPNNLFFGEPDGDQALDGPTKAETNRHMQRIAGVMLGGFVWINAFLISWFGRWTDLMTTLKNDVGLLPALPITL